MDKETLVNLLKQKQEIHAYASQALNDPATLQLLFEIIETDLSAVKFQCEKIIRHISESHPQVLYPYFERMASLMESSNNFLKWGFILSLPNLLKVDTRHKWKKVSARFLSFLQSDSLITFGNAVRGVGKILTQYPEYEKALVTAILNVDQITFLHKGQPSPECLNVAKGHIMDCIVQIYPNGHYQRQMQAFVQANLNNPRNQVRLKAEKFLKKFPAAQAVQAPHSAVV